MTDGNQATYWESANNAFPQWVQVDLGSSVSTNQVVLKLPTAGWGSRNQTLAVQGSTDACRVVVRSCEGILATMRQQ